MSHKCQIGPVDFPCGSEANWWAFVPGNDPHATACDSCKDMLLRRGEPLEFVKITEKPPLGSHAFTSSKLKTITEIASDGHEITTVTWTHSDGVWTPVVMEGKAMHFRDKTLQQERQERKEAIRKIIGD